MLFGPLIRLERLKRGMKLWKFAAAVPFPLSNIQRIESGNTEPRIGVAMNMLAALNVKAGPFMEALAKAQNWPFYGLDDSSLTSKLPELAEELLWERRNTIQSPKTEFGLFFKKVRLASGLTQTILAERADYTSRSLIAVENGRQEPKVMRALRLVSALGMDTAIFFDNFSRLKSKLGEVNIRENIEIGVRKQIEYQEREKEQA